MKNLNNLSALPDSALKDITASDPVQSQQAASNTPSTDGILSDADILATGDHANNSGFNSLAKPPIGPNGPTPATSLNPGSNPVKLGSVVGGKIATDLIDVLLPSLCVWGISSIGYSIDKKGLQMTSKEKEIAAPAIQAYMDSINIDFSNPLYNLLFVMAAIYGAKVIDILPNLEKKKPRTGAKVIEDRKDEFKIPKSDDDWINEIAKKRKKGTQEAMNYFYANKEKFTGEKIS